MLKLGFVIIAAIGLFFAFVIAGTESLGAARPLLTVSWIAIVLYGMYLFARQDNIGKSSEERQQQYARRLRQISGKRAKSRGYRT